MDKNITVKRGIYILPSLFTLASLAVGFISIIWSINHRYTNAAWAVIVSIGLDIFDGRVARWTKTASKFGVELDSLADLVAFGIAPAILIYQVVLHTLSRPGLAIALFFVLAGAIRLARFNVKALENDEVSPHFVGLPIPAAAGILASFVLSYQLFEDNGEITVKTIPLLMDRMPFIFKYIPPTMVLISILMLSNVPYASFKKLKLSRPKSLQLLVFVVLTVLLIITYPQNTIFIIFMLYLFTGLIGYIIRYWRLRRSFKISFRLRKTQNKDTDES